MNKETTPENEKRKTGTKQILCLCFNLFGTTGPLRRHSHTRTDRTQWQMQLDHVSYVVSGNVGNLLYCLRLFDVFLETKMGERKRSFAGMQESCEEN